jgi:hypothetical protein
MIKTTFLVAVTILVVFFGLSLAGNYFDFPRSQIFAWTGIIFLVYLIERLLKYLIQLPFKLYSEQLRRNPLAKAVQDTGITLSYISFWLAIGFTPINGVVQGVNTKLTFSNPFFLQISVVLFFATLLFSILWWFTLKLKR